MYVRPKLTFVSFFLCFFFCTFPLHASHRSLLARLNPLQEVGESNLVLYRVGGQSVVHSTDCDHGVRKSTFSGPSSLSLTIFCPPTQLQWPKQGGEDCKEWANHSSNRDVVWKNLGCQSEAEGRGLVILYHITGRTPDLKCIFGNHLTLG